MTKPKQKVSRVAILRERIEQAERDKGPTFDVPFRGKSIPLRRVRIETDFALYRIQSGRTHRAQSEYLERHKHLDRHFFDDPEDPQVQRAQHEILLVLISERELDTDLRDRGQLAPLVLTYDGYVVDGNRRLAALRQDREQYAEAVVLPEDAQAHEIYETEIELQMQRETKAPYDWVDQAVHIEYGLKSLGERPEVLAKRMRMSKDAVLAELQKLELVRMYLGWLGYDGQIHKVPTTGSSQMEQAFEDMTQRFTSAAFKRKPEPQRRMIREMCFISIKRGAGYKEIRSLIKQLSQHSEVVSQRLQERTAKEPGEPNRHDGPQQRHTPSRHDDDPLRDFALTAPTTPDHHIQDLLHATKHDEAASSVLDIVEELEAEDRESKKQQQPLQRVETALSSLKQVVLDEHTEGLDAIAKALGRVSQQVEKLTATVDKLRSHHR